MLSIGIFFFTSFISIAIVFACFKAIEEFEKFSPPTVSRVESNRIEPASIVTDIDATFDPAIDYETRLRTKLITTGDFHAEDVPYRSGEKWLGLFRTASGYELAPTEIEVKHGAKDELFSSTVSTRRSGESVFLLRDSKLKPNKIETVFDELTDGFSFQDEQTKSFVYMDVEYILHVENVPLEGYLQAGSALTLEAAGNRQIISYLPTNCNDCSWSLQWSGDLDSDGKLDFLLDLAGHYNAYSPTLFLSSKAKQNEIVGIAAGYSGVGC